MRKALLTVALLSGAAGLLVFGHPAEVRAQVLFCPPDLIQVKGSCVAVPSGQAGGAVGAFSGAALASQALSELSETTTQESTRNTLKAVSERREQEEQRCAEGFSRVDGTCQRNPRPVSRVAAAPPAPEPGLAEVHEPKGTKAKVAAARRRRFTAPAQVVRREPAPPPVFLPVPIEPAIRLGTWHQAYGDYEKRNATGFAVITNPGSDPGVATVDAKSRTGTFGVLAGADLTSRSIIFGNDGLIAGVMAGYVSSNVTVKVTSLTSNQDSNPGLTNLHATLSGPSAGLYATYFSGGFSTDFTLKADALNLNETINGVLAFPVTETDFVDLMVPFTGGGSTSVLNATVAGNLNYRFDLYPNFWIEPTAGAQYTNSSYRSNAADLGLTDGNLVMLQGGARFGTTALINNRVLMTTTLTGLAYDDVLVTGSFVPAAALIAQNLFAQADQGHVRGRGILALNLDFGDGISTFAQGEVRGGSGIFGAGGRAGFRVNW